jgi:hypothetical protein
MPRDIPLPNPRRPGRGSSSRKRLTDRRFEQIANALLIVASVALIAYC